MRLCSRCGIEKPDDEFYVQRRRGKEGRQRICKPCSKAYLDQWRRDNPEAIAASDRKKVLMRRYGLTVEKYDAMHVAQHGVCAICGKPERTVQRPGGPVQWLAVDHDRRTGKIRGLLCQPCNRTLGNLGDDLDGAMRFVRYLERSERTPLPAGP